MWGAVGAFLVGLPWWGWVWLVVAVLIIAITLIAAAYTWLSDWDELSPADARLAMAFLVGAPFWPLAPVLFLMLLMGKIIVTAMAKENY